MGAAGLEPACPKALDFESSPSTNSGTLPSLDLIRPPDRQTLQDVRLVSLAPARSSLVSMSA